MPLNLRTLTLADAHAKTGIPVKSLRVLIDRGELAGNKIGRKYFVSEESLYAWVHRTPEPPSDSTAAPSAFPEAEDDRFA